MSSSDLALSVRNLGKAYTIRHNRGPGHTTLAEAIVDRVRHPIRALRGLSDGSSSESFWALRDVNFDVRKGEVVGIIGRNGAGKSTLLKILSRITEPTEGQIDLYGRVGSLLEVGTGFHQELTGRENIFLNGAILGMTRAEIKRQFDAIVDFSGVEQFLDTPVKRYSSGMYVRLAFAVAAHLRSEILVVDEVLAVGDAEFQRKCLGKMKQVSTDGRTVLFVSHNMQSIVTLCSDALLLESGRLRMQGETRAAADQYKLSVANVAAKADESHARRRGSGEYRLQEVSPEKSIFESAEPKVIRFRASHEFGQLGEMFVMLELFDNEGTMLAHIDSRMHGRTIEDAGEIAGTCTIRTPWLKPGTYRVTVHLGAGGTIDQWDYACAFEVVGSPYDGSLFRESSDRGRVFADFDFDIASVARPRATPALS